MEAFKRSPFYSRFLEDNKTVRVIETIINDIPFSDIVTTYRKLGLSSFMMALCRCANHHTKQLDCSDMVSRIHS